MKTRYALLLLDLLNINSKEATTTASALATEYISTTVDDWSRKGTSSYYIAKNRKKCLRIYLIYGANKTAASAIM